MVAQLWSRLPAEKLERVLPCLPVRDLWRCSTVCKRWNHLMSTPGFASRCFRSSQALGRRYTVARSAWHQTRPRLHGTSVGASSTWSHNSGTHLRNVVCFTGEDLQIWPQFRGLWLVMEVWYVCTRRAWIVARFWRFAIRFRDEEGGFCQIHRGIGDALVTIWLSTKLRIASRFASFTKGFTESILLQMNCLGMMMRFGVFGCPRTLVILSVLSCGFMNPPPIDGGAQPTHPWSTCGSMILGSVFTEAASCFKDSYMFFLVLMILPFSGFMLTTSSRICGRIPEWTSNGMPGRQVRSFPLDLSCATTACFWYLGVPTPTCQVSLNSAAGYRYKRSCLRTWIHTCRWCFKWQER